MSSVAKGGGWCCQVVGFDENAERRMQERQWEAIKGGSAERRKEIAKKEGKMAAKWKVKGDGDGKVIGIR